MKTFIKTLIIFVIGILLIAMIPKTNADEEPIVIDLVVVPSPTPIPIPAPTVQPHVEIFSWDQKTIDALASIYWAEVGSGQNNIDKEKQAITYLIFNRRDFGDPFATTILGVCEQKNEFNHGRVSDRNRKLAERYLNYGESRSRGYYTGFDIPKSAVYMGRGEDNVLIFYDIHWAEVWRSK